MGSTGSPQVTFALARGSTAARSTTSSGTRTGLLRRPRGRHHGRPRELSRPRCRQSELERRYALPREQAARCPFLVELFDCLREQGDFLHAVMGPKGDPSFGPRVRDARVHRNHPDHPARALPQRSLAVRAVLRGVLRERVSGGHHALGRNGHAAKVRRRWHLSPCSLFFIKPGDPIQAVNGGDTDGRREHERSGIDGRTRRRRLAHTRARCTPRTTTVDATPVGEPRREGCAAILALMSARRR